MSLCTGVFGVLSRSLAVVVTPVQDESQGYTGVNTVVKLLVTSAVSYGFSSSALKVLSKIVSWSH